MIVVMIIFEITRNEARIVLWVGVGLKVVYNVLLLYKM